MYEGNLPIHPTIATLEQDDLYEHEMLSLFGLSLRRESAMCSYFLTSATRPLTRSRV